MSKKNPSRADRWNEATARVHTLCDDLSVALESLRDVQSEYEDWRDNLPENLQSSVLGEKLEAVCDLDIESALDSVKEVEELMDECEGADLPMGFGRD